jgi:NADPH:quinone reductase-like Zn-dependent oxidoreductase
VATTTSAGNYDLVKKLGADVVIDYRKEDFQAVLHDYDLVVNSQDAKTLEKSLRILEPGGKVISISGPPDVAFGREIGLSWLMRTVLSFLSKKVRSQARKRQVEYSFLFMQPNGEQLAEIGQLMEAGALRPVLDKVFPFAQVNEALAYVESGRARGKVVVKVR